MDYVFEIVELAESPTLEARATCAHDQIGPTIGALFAKIGPVMKGQELEMAGPPHCKYLDWRQSDCDISAGCPVATPGRSEDEVVASTLPGGRALKTTHYGPYDQLRTAWEAGIAHVSEANLTVTGAPWELYLTDPGKEPDPNNWITELYFPIA